MTSSTFVISIGRALLLFAFLALALSVGSQPAGAACSDTAARYPMLLGSGYEGTPCQPAAATCSDIAERYPMLLGSGYEGGTCVLGTSTPSREPAARPVTDPSWHETMLDGSGYEGHIVDAALSERKRT